MKEQEKLKEVLKKIIDDTESYAIQTTEELLRTLISELNEGVLVLSD